MKVQRKLDPDEHGVVRAVRFGLELIETWNKDPRSDGRGNALAIARILVQRMEEHSTTDGQPYVDPEPPIPEGYRKAVAGEVAKKNAAVKDDDGEAYIPAGYAETLACMNKPNEWNVPGIIADMAEHIRRGNEAPEGQVLAALDWMTFRLRECRSVLVTADSELSAISHGRPIDKVESQKISDDARKICKSLKGY